MTCLEQKRLLTKGNNRSNIGWVGLKRGRKTPLKGAISSNYNFFPWSL